MWRSSGQSKRTKKPAPAFTLIEITMTMALLVIIVATVGPNFRKSTLSTKGAALSLAAALAEARQQAITQQIPVALVIPSGNGTQGQADSYYIASGEQPRVTQVRSLGSEQPDLRLMVGHWPLNTSKLKDSTLTTTVTPPPETLWENEFDVNEWDLPAAQDYAFIFTPRGKLVSNGLPHFDGAYHIIVSHGGTSTASPLPNTSGITDPPTLYSPTQVGSPYTVSINTQGAVSVTLGVVGAPDGETYVKEQAQTIPPPNPPTLAPLSDSAPVVTSVTLLPDPGNLDPPTGVDILLAPGRHMTITTRAQSPDKLPLFCEWKATGGGLSSPQEARAEYLPQSQEWESVWQWRFPADAKPGDVFTIEGIVKDQQGNETSVGLGVGKADPFVVQMGDDSTRIAFTSRRSGAWKMYTINGDGTGLTDISGDFTGDGSPVWSPDGQRLVFISARSGRTEIWLKNFDGTGDTQLTRSTLGDVYYPLWTPEGAEIFFNPTSPNWQIHRMNADGSSLRRIVNTAASLRPVISPTPGGPLVFYSNRLSPGFEQFLVKRDGTSQTNFTNLRSLFGSSTYYVCDGPSWSPDGRKIAYYAQRPDDGNTEIYVADVMPDFSSSPTGGINVTNDSSSDNSAAWSPDGSQIAFVSRRNAANEDIFLMNPDGSNVRNISNTFPGREAFPTWSRDGSHIIFTSNQTGNYDIYIMKADGTEVRNLTNHLTDELTFSVR